MMTWADALCAVVEPTEIGWTQKSCDRIWHLVTVEDGQEGDRISKFYKGNWIYLAERFTSYDPMDETLCFSSRREAVQYLAAMPPKYRVHWHTINLGDMLRQERAYFTGQSGLHGEGFTPKYRGSDAAFELKRAIARA